MRAATPAAAVVVTAAALLAPVVVDSPAHAGGCPAVKHYVIGGVGASDAHGVPRPAGAEVIHYPASLAPVGGNVSGDRSVAVGTQRLDARARAFRAACPQSRIEVTGASMGALVAGDVRDSWQHDPTMRRNVKFVLISDPRAKRGAMAMLPSFIPGFTHTGARPASTIETSSICRDNDLICNIGNPLADPGHAINSAVGYLVEGAHGYGAREVNRAPGKHTLPANDHTVPDTPIPWQPPTPRQILEPIVQAVVPDVPIVMTPPTPVRDMVPREVRQFVPPQIGDIVIQMPRLGR